VPFLFHGVQMGCRTDDIRLPIQIQSNNNHNKIIRLMKKLSAIFYDLLRNNPKVAESEQLQRQ
jgi:hypothetical protein